MARLDKKYLGRLQSVTDLQKQDVSGEHEGFLDRLGVIRIFISEKTAPGKSKIEFYPLDEEGREVESDFYKTPYGDLYEDLPDKKLKIKADGGYYNFIFIHGA